MSEESLFQSLCQAFNLTFYHLPQWYALLHDTYGHDSVYILATDNDGRVLGFMPITFVEIPLLGKKAISSPYQISVGGVLCCDAHVAECLYGEAIIQCQKRGVEFLEIRSAEYAEVMDKLGFEKVVTNCSVTLCSLDDCTKGNIRKGHRSDFNKAKKFGVELTKGTSLDDWRAFYELYETEQRAHGAPGHGWSFLKSLHEMFPDNALVRLAWKDDICVGGMLLFCFGDTVFYKQGAMPGAYVVHGVAKYLIWETMQEMKNAGYKYFNFGLTHNSQTHLLSYKEGFAASSEELVFYARSFGGHKVTNIGDVYSGHGFLKKVWQNLPLSVTKIMGPIVSRWYC